MKLTNYLKNLVGHTECYHSKSNQCMKSFNPKYLNCLLLSFAVTSCVLSVHAQNEKFTVSGYEGSTLIGKYQSNYVQYLVPEGPLTYDEFLKNQPPKVL